MCSPLEKKKYFGENARENFFTRNKWLKQQLNITQSNHKEQNTCLYFGDNVDLYDIAEENTLSTISAIDDRSVVDSSDSQCFITHIIDPLNTDSLSVSALTVNCEPDPPPKLAVSRSNSSILGRKTGTSLSFSPLKRSTSPIPGSSSKNNLDTPMSPAEAILAKRTRFPLISPNRSSSTDGETPTTLSRKRCDDPLLSQSKADILETLAIPNSPRTLYLVGCSQNNVLPRASLLIRKQYTKELNLQHKGVLVVLTYVYNHPI